MSNTAFESITACELQTITGGSDFWDAAKGAVNMTSRRTAA
jgi:bacteriocin-like protein